MAHASHLTPLEKRTMMLFTIVGVVGSLLGTIVVAVYYLIILGISGMCDDACSGVGAELAHIFDRCIAIVFFAIVLSFLRVLYTV